MVGVELLSYSIHQGQTIYQGKSTYQVQVYNVEDDKVEFEEGPVESVYPPNIGVSNFERTEREFRKEYLASLSDDIGCLFYTHDKHRGVTADSVALE